MKLQTTLKKQRQTAPYPKQMGSRQVMTMMRKAATVVTAKEPDFYLKQAANLQEQSTDLHLKLHNALSESALNGPERDGIRTTEAIKVNLFEKVTVLMSSWQNKCGKPGLLIESGSKAWVWYLTTGDHLDPHDCLKVGKNAPQELKHLSKNIGPDTIQYTIQDGFHVYMIGPHIVSFLQKFGIIYDLHSPLSQMSSAFFTEKNFKHPPQFQHVNSSTRKIEGDLSEVHLLNKVFAKTSGMTPQRLAPLPRVSNTDEPISPFIQAMLKITQSSENPQIELPSSSSSSSSSSKRKHQSLAQPQPQKKVKTTEVAPKKVTFAPPNVQLKFDLTPEEEALLLEQINYQSLLVVNPENPSQKIPSDQLKQLNVSTIAMLREKLCDADGNPKGFLNAYVLFVKEDEEGNVVTEKTDGQCYVDLWNNIEPDDTLKVHLFFHSPKPNKFGLHSFRNRQGTGKALSHMLSINEAIPKSGRTSATALTRVFVHLPNAPTTRLIPLMCFANIFLKGWESVNNGVVVYNQRIQKQEAVYDLNQPFVPLSSPFSQPLVSSPPPIPACFEKVREEEEEAGFEKVEEEEEASSAESSSSSESESESDVSDRED